MTTAFNGRFVRNESGLTKQVPCNVFRGCHFESENVHESRGRFVYFYYCAVGLNCKLGQFLVHFLGYFIGLLLLSDRVHSIDAILARLLDKTCKFPMHYLHTCMFNNKENLQ